MGGPNIADRSPSELRTKDGAGRIPDVVYYGTNLLGNQGGFTAVPKSSATVF